MTIPDANFSEIHSGTSSNSNLSCSSTSPVKRTTKRNLGSTEASIIQKESSFIYRLPSSTISEWLKISFSTRSSFFINEQFIDWNKKWIMLKSSGRREIICCRLFACKMAAFRSFASLSLSLICKDVYGLVLKIKVHYVHIQVEAEKYGITNS